MEKAPKGLYGIIQVETIFSDPKTKTEIVQGFAPSVSIQRSVYFPTSEFYAGQPPKDVLNYASFKKLDS